MGYLVMVVVHRAYGYRFVIYTMDHKPAHVHIAGPGRAKINLCGKDGAPELVYVIDIKQSDVRRIMAEVLERQQSFLRDWERIHGDFE